MNPTIHELMASLPEQVTHHIQHLERMRQDFVANVSHELRTPLTVMHGYLESLLSQNRDETQPWKKIFTQMQQQTIRMENLIEDLLLLSRLESQDDENAISEAVDVTSLLKAICHDAEEFSAEAKHHIKIQADTKLFLLGNSSELRSLFSNIIFNAVKYTPPDGHIDIQWHYVDKKSHFSVCDTGIGIAKEHIPRITERFYRVDPARSRASGGTGLGLAIAKHVLLRHQATLTIESELNKGSQFTCVFPLQRTKKIS
ncbi:MAG: phoR [Gammaproteobacteria bacterium]|jgi:two-component system phosphate regulon sensor histidine kinase PhoR|nr:phoR [Gammaproteobacteria bacterium]